MRKAVCVLIVAVASVGLAWGSPINLALGKPVTSEGGSIYGNPVLDLSLVVDGVFCNGCPRDSAGPYWYSAPVYVDIDLQGAYQISGAIVQADDNDMYLLQYRDLLGVYHDWWNIPTNPITGGGLSTRPNNGANTQWQYLSSVTATGLRLWGVDTHPSDGFFSVSEVQVANVPEPAMFLPLGAGLLGLCALARKRRGAA